jgi:serine-type D-Ala-D-Ala carboxypeptidase (penicillin-binding protein 5/6)
VTIKELLARAEEITGEHAAPIASLAKVMTACLVLRDHPLRPGRDGPTITLTVADVVDTERRSRQQEIDRADRRRTTRSLGMTHTCYTDPSGYDDATVSTPADQLRIVDRAMRLPAFASIVATPNATLPVAGTVHNTNALLGHDGFVGVKTGSDRAAGGCLAFRAARWIAGKRTTITGVVLGQPGQDQIAAALAAADAMVERIAAHRAMPGRERQTTSSATALGGRRPPLRARERRPAKTIDA